MSSAQYEYLTIGEEGIAWKPVDFNNPHWQLDPFGQPVYVTPAPNEEEVDREMDGTIAERLAKIKDIIETHARSGLEPRNTRDLIYSYLCAWEIEDAQKEQALIAWREQMETTGYPKVTSGQ